MQVNTLERRASVDYDLHGLVRRLVDIIAIGASAHIASRYRCEASLAICRFDAIFAPFSMACWLTLMPVFGVYQSWRGRSMMLLVRRVLIAWISVQTCVWVLMLCLHSTNDAARLWFAYWAGAGSVALAGVRIVTYAVLGRLRHAGLNQRCVALVGDIGHLRRLLLNIEAAPGSGFRPEAVFCPRDDVSGAEIGLRVFMDFEAFVSHVREANVHELWLALPLSDQSTIVRFLGTFREDLINIRLVPDVGGLALFDGGLVELLGSPAINLAASPLSPAALAQKAAFDRVFAIFVLVAGAPIFMAIAVAIKLSSPGPVFFRQRRRGANGRIFSIYKFRSMHVHQQADGGLQQATRADPRITRVGAFLRRTSLDELPQFINVLRGEMSVVGPRPHAIEHDELYGKVIDRYIHRYRIKPGITGWAQVNGYRGETEQVEKMQKRVEHDFYYLCNWSMAFDIKIIATTLLKGFIHRNAY